MHNHEVLSQCSNSSREAQIESIPTADTKVPNTSGHSSDETLGLPLVSPDAVRSQDEILVSCTPDAKLPTPTIELTLAEEPRPSNSFLEEVREKPMGDGKRIEHNQNQNLYNPHNTNRHRPTEDIRGTSHYAKGTCSAYPTPTNDLSPHMTVVNPPSPISVSVGSRKRSYDAISSSTQVDIESLTDRVAHQINYLEECGAIHSDMADEAGMAYNRFVHEDLIINVKVFLYAKTVGSQIKRLERDLKTYDQMLKNDHRY